MTLQSELEQHLGEFWDPTPHQDEIVQANEVLGTFVADMDANRVPSATLGDLQTAVGTLGKYAGYPADACNTEMFLESKYASSYRTTANVVHSFVKDMNMLIAERLRAVAEANSLKANPVSKPQFSDDNLPF